MKRSLVALILPITLATLLPTSAFAQGLFNSAEVLEKDAMRVGAELIVGSIGVMGHVRYGAGDAFDVGVRSGIVSESDLNRFNIGFDARYGLMSAEGGDAADINAVGLFHLTTGNKITTWSLGVGPQIGTEIPFSGSDVTLSPHVAVLVGATHTGSGGGTTEIDGQTVQVNQFGTTDFGVLIPLGAEIAMNEQISINAEVDIDIDGGTDAVAAFGIIYNYR